MSSLRKVVILGSSRQDGDTAAVVERLSAKTDCKVINLSDYNISYYDYNYANRDDDYLPLMRDILDNYDMLIFATPVYWYSMSGIMKVFFDRLTDLLTIEKGLGRQLRGKKMAAISSSGGNDLDDSFWLPFRETAAYLGMDYIGDLHTNPARIDDEALDLFARELEAGSQKNI